MEISEQVPKGKFKYFHEILVKTGGRYKVNPYAVYGTDNVKVTYYPGDYKKQTDLWATHNVEIKELNTNKFHYKLARRAKLVWKNLW